MGGKRGYLYDQIKHPVQFHYAERIEDMSENFLKNYQKKVVYLSHIEHKYYLSIEKREDQIAENPNLLQLGNKSFS